MALTLASRETSITLKHTRTLEESLESIAKRQIAPVNLVQHMLNDYPQHATRKLAIFALLMTGKCHTLSTAPQRERKMKALKLVSILACLSAVHAGETAHAHFHSNSSIVHDVVLLSPVLLFVSAHLHAVFGGEDGEGLDLTGDFTYAISMGINVGVPAQGLAIGDALFLSVALGITGVASAFPEVSQAFRTFASATHCLCLLWLGGDDDCVGLG